jgi:iron complex outermembrane recepter protein
MLQRTIPLLLFLAPAAVQAQTTVHGSVVDRQTGAPIAGASVVVTGTAVGATTNDAGAFRLVASGAIQSVTVTGLGYDTTRVAVTDPTNPLIVRLAPAAVTLPGVEVMGQRPTPAVATLTQANLEKASGLKLRDVINTVPGVFMQSRTPFGGARITIRGYYPSTSGNSPNSNGLGYQVFLNDIPVTDATGATVLDDIDYSTLGRVEVIKGPASSRYGSAIGGTVNLTTERPTPGQTSVEQQGLGGSDGLFRTNTSLRSATDNSAILLNYGHQHDNSFRDHSASSKDYVRASGDFSAGERQTISAFFSHSHSFEELAGEIDSSVFYARDAANSTNPAYLANDSHIELAGVVAGVTDHYRLSDVFTNQTTVFASGRTSNQPFAHGFTDVNQVNLGARSEFGYTGQAGTVGITGSLGALVQRSNLTSNGVFIIPAPPYPERPTAQENYAIALSLYSEWNFTLPGAVTLTAGASLNRNVFAIQDMLVGNQLFDTTSVMERSFPFVITPRLALTKQLGSQASVYAGVSTGFTPPLLSNTIANDGTVDLSLKPERAVQYEVGAQGGLAGGRLTGQVALYDVENTNKLVTETSGAVTFTTNAGKQRNQGVELSLSARLVDDPQGPVSLLRPWVSYTYTKAEFVDFKSNNNNDSTTVDYSGNAVPRVPKSMVSAGVDLATRPGFYLNGTYQHVDKVPVTFDNSTWVRSYDLLGARVGYRRRLAGPWLLDAFAGGDNLLGSTYYTFLFVGADYGGLAQAADGGRGDGYIIPGSYNATLYGSLTLRYVF